MKNKNLWKVLGITAAIVVLLTWIIPASSFDGYEVAMTQITPAGIWDWFTNLGTALGYFWEGGLLLLFIGGFYGVLNKTGILKNIINSITKCFKGKEKWFLILSIALFMIISSLTGIYLPLFIFVPLFVAIILAMGYSKMIALITTVGSAILGSMNLLYNDSIYQALSVKAVDAIWLKLLLLALTLGTTIFYVLKTIGKKSKGTKEELDNNILFTEKKEETKGKKKKVWPLVTIFAVLFVVMVLGMVPWTGLFNLKIFTDFHNSVIGVKLGNFPVFQNILGYSIPALGNWNIMDMVVLLGLSSILVTFIYKLKGKDALEGFIDGVKQYAVMALLVVLINIVVVFTLNSGFYATIMKALIGLTDKLNIFIMSIVTFFGSILTISPVYITNYNVSIIQALVDSSTSMPLIALIQQTMYGLAMFIAPTSMMLLAGLAYLEIPYTKWLKYVWKLVIALVVLIFIILVTAALVL
jgi:uncharacterized ion transporter superfamily protein YfcC